MPSPQGEADFCCSDGFHRQAEGVGFQTVHDGAQLFAGLLCQIPQIAAVIAAKNLLFFIILTPYSEFSLSAA